jgi:alanyl-tRNA synthetase
VQQIDGLTPGDLRELALAIRNVSGIRAVVLAGVTDTGGVAIVAATTPSISVSAGSLIAAAAKAVGGGGGGKGDIATAGGKNAAGLPEAISLAGASVRASGAISPKGNPFCDSRGLSLDRGRGAALDI